PTATTTPPCKTHIHPCTSYFSACSYSRNVELLVSASPHCYSADHHNASCPNTPYPCVPYDSNQPNRRTGTRQTTTEREPHEQSKYSRHRTRPPGRNTSNR